MKFNFIFVNLCYLSSKSNVMKAKIANSKIKKSGGQSLSREHSEKDSAAFKQIKTEPQYRRAMYERRLKQKELAKLMGLSEPKLSQILSGKRAPDVAFLKAAHQKLGIDAAFLLNHV
jgi:predicted XRE-type DNA-binding protein